MRKFLICLSFFVSLISYGKDINVGDLVTFEVSGVEKEELTNIFTKDNVFIKNIQEVKGENGEKKYRVELKFFTAGIEKFVIKDKILEIDVKSSLNGEKEIYPNLSDNSEKNLYKTKFPIRSFSSILIVGYSLFQLIKGIRKKEDRFTPEDIFKKNMESLSQEKWNFEISKYLRKYIDSKYKSRFLSGVYEKINRIDDEDIIFLEELDIGKFSTKKIEDREHCVKKAFMIFEKISKGDDKNV